MPLDSAPRTPPGDADLIDVRPDLPEALAHVVETAINASPQKRFASTGR